MLLELGVIRRNHDFNLIYPESFTFYSKICTLVFRIEIVRAIFCKLDPEVPTNTFLFGG